MNLLFLNAEFIPEDLICYALICYTPHSVVINFSQYIYSGMKMTFEMKESVKFDF